MTSIAPTAIAFGQRGLAEDAAGRADVLLLEPTEAEHLQATDRAAVLLDHDLHGHGGAAAVLRRDELDRVLGPGLAARPRVDHVGRAVEHEEVVVVRCRSEGIVPLEEADEAVEGPDQRVVGGVLGSAEEIVKVVARRRPVGLLQVRVRLVARRRVIGDAGLDGPAHGGRHRAVLEERLIEEPDIVDDNVRPRGDQAVDGLDEPDAAVDPL